MKNKILNFIKQPLWLVVYLNNRGFHFFNDKVYLKILFKLHFNKKLDFNNPKTINEKLQWLKLNDRNPLYSTLVDKSLVKDYVARIIGVEYIIPTIAVYNNVKDINFDSLPDKYVMKCTHDSGCICICNDKNDFDKVDALKKLKKSLNKNYYYYGREWPYKNVKPRIIIEKNMSELSSVDDYKFYCFNGKVHFVMIVTNRFSKEGPKADFFDDHFNYLDFTWGFEHCEERPKKPQNFDKMIKIAEKLSATIPHVRVDLYNLNSKIYFGEMTFYDSSGFEPILPAEWDLKIGNMLNLDFSYKQK